MSRHLMIQGTHSDAGKSTLVTALCRALHRRGWNVAPFKPQNMALNSAVSVDGGEIGRAQAVQAQACGLEPHSDMNPVLLKPTTDRAAQVILRGRAIGTLDAVAYHDYKRRAREAVLAAWADLTARHEAVIVEGAGSPAEINLRENDIANMGFAEAVDSPVILIADIDKGGVFAQIIGTLALLSKSERARVRGLVINRFRGDLSLLRSGLDWLEQETGKPVLGVLPYIHDLHLDAEDALPNHHSPACETAGRTLRVVVPVLPRISNHTDLDPLRHHPAVELTWVRAGQPLPPADLIVLPGSKSVRDDLAVLRERGWDRELLRHLRYGGKLIGICGGYQMIGRIIRDPQGIEGEPGDSIGLNLLPVQTTLMPEKQLRRVEGRLAGSGAKVIGYEIHAGVSTLLEAGQPAIELPHGPDGLISDDGQVMGCYVHGLFDHPEACAALLDWAGLDARDQAAVDMAALRERDIERLAEMVETHLDMPRILSILEEALNNSHAPLRCLPARPGGRDMKTLILGGARSGKSALTERLAADCGLPVSVIVTAEIRDAEMAARIARHREDRPAHWHTVEAPRALAAALQAQAREGHCLIVDCLTLWLTNLMLDEDPQRLDAERDALLDILPTLPGRILFVANEVGLGIVPDNALARRFRDEAGRLNQAMAARCDDVLFVAAGLPMTLKTTAPPG